MDIIDSASYGEDVAAELTALGPRVVLGRNTERSHVEVWRIPAVAAADRTVVRIEPQQYPAITRWIEERTAQDAAFEQADRRALEQGEFADAQWRLSKERLHNRAKTMRVVRSAGIVTTGGGLGRVERVVLWVVYGDPREHCEKWQRFVTTFYNGSYDCEPSASSWSTADRVANPEEYPPARSDGKGVSVGSNDWLYACDVEDRYRDELLAHLRFRAERGW